jgi:hypothetical protein
MGLLYSYPLSLLWQKGESELCESIGLPQPAIQQEEIRHKENGFATQESGLNQNKYTIKSSRFSIKLCGP